MSDAAPIVAPWLRLAFHELARHRHLLLHGRTDDLIRWNHAYVPFHEGLQSFLRDAAEYEVVGSFDLVDGLQFTDDRERDAFMALVPDINDEHTGDAEPTGDDRASAPTGAPAPSAGTDGTSERRQRLDASARRIFDQVRSRERVELRRPSDALVAIRSALATSERPIAIVVDAAELLLGDVARTDAQYREHSLLLQKALRETGHVRGPDDRANVLVLLCRRLSDVPDWLYTGNSRVASVSVQLPGVVERGAIVREHLDRFAGGDQMSETDIETAATALANLTEGMGVLDILALGATSRLAQISLSAPKRLVLHHRSGLREDPWSQLDQKKIVRAGEHLAARVHGQPAAIESAANMLINANVGLDFVADADSASTRPRGVFFFVGPTGVGKTELAKAIAEFLFDDEAAMKRFDMSEYGQEHATERLTGAPPGYVGHEAGGALTNWMLENPFSVILFDEIEKAHGRVFDKFLQIMDDGRLTDGQGRTAFFSNAVVIFTSNKGSDEIYRRLQGAGRDLPEYHEIEQIYHRAVDDYFAADLRRPELLGRIGKGVVVFDILRPDALERIADKFLDQISNSARARDITLIIDRAPIVEYVTNQVLRTGVRLGARQIRDPVLDTLVRTPLNRWILRKSPLPGTQILITFDCDAKTTKIIEMPRAQTEAVAVEARAHQ